MFQNFFNSCSYYIWPTNESKAEEAEWKLLNSIKGLGWVNDKIEKDKEEKEEIIKRGELKKVYINDKDYINTFSIYEKERDKVKGVLILTHGYGNGLGHYFQNYEALVNLRGWDIHSIDWLGMGRSSRPHFNLKKKKGQTELDHIKEAEDFFVESFEEWTKKMGLEKFHLLGHSLGGYLSTVYALKYADKVEKLLLASPVGIPKSPYLVDNSDEAKLEAAHQQQEIDSPLANSEFAKRPTNIPFWVPYAWDKLNVTPQWLVRMAGPYGPKLISYYTDRRLAHLNQDQKKMLEEYLYHISSMKGSGEYALGSILSFGAFARYPLHKRMTKLTMPVTFIYGEVDWMDFRHALKIKDNFNVPIKIHVLPEVGHQLFLEKAEHFNEFLVKELQSNNTEPFTTNIDINQFA